METGSKISLGSFIAVMCLVAGTCVGGGMLALPVATGGIGFLPSVVMIVVCWMFMTATGLLLLEVSLWMGEDTHIITMTSRLLGPFGKGVAWVVYLFIAYASLVAYIAGGGNQVAEGLLKFFSMPFVKWQGCLVFASIFGIVIYFGKDVVGRINAILFSSMVIAYIALLGTGMQNVDVKLLATVSWNRSFLAVPLLLTAFSYASIVPSLPAYLKSNPRYLRLAIVCGTTIALIIYLVWEYLVLGTIPATGEHGLIAALEQGRETTFFLGAVVGNKWFIISMAYFSFFAIVTSFLGIGLGLFDFLSDGFKIKKSGLGKLSLIFLVILPSLYFAVTYPRAFYVGLETTGGFGDTILFGIIPVLMVWIGRYHNKWKSEAKLPGGKFALVSIVLFSLAVIVLEIFEQFKFMLD